MQIIDIFIDVDYTVYTEEDFNKRRYISIR